MAAGAIPPPLFFERRRALRAYSAPAPAFSREQPEQYQRRLRDWNAGGEMSPASRDRYLSKDI
jgi:hypothetical protein